MRLYKHCCFRLCALAILGLGYSLQAFAAAYDIVALTVGAGSASDINNQGQVVGNDPNGAFLYSSGAITYLGPYGADAVNDNGDVLLRSGQQTSGDYYLYSGGTVTPIGPLWGTDYSIVGINDSGQLAGTVTISPQSCDIDGCIDAIDHAYIYSNGSSTDLGAMSSGSKSSYAADLNNSGQVVGASTSYSDLTHAVLWSGGTMLDLGTLGGSYSQAYGINDQGQITGYAYDASNNFFPFLYSGGVMTKIGALSGWGTDINNAGQVVGFRYSGGDFLYSNGTVTALDALLPASSGWTLLSARAINDAGQIVGYGHLNGQTRAFLMTPTAVPIPSAFWLFGSGIAGAFGIARRRKGR
jgi:probable HAF family extracellular repeat protein